MATTEMDKCPLSGLRVLVTRPDGQQQSLQLALAGAGAQVEHIPAMAIEPLVAVDLLQRIKSRVLDLDLYDEVVVVSANAARYWLDWVDQYWPQQPLGVHWWAIGPATATLLAAADIEADIAQPHTSEGLLGDDYWQQMLFEGRRALLVKGVGGRTTIADGLQKLGLQVDTCDLYQRQLATASAAPLRQWLQGEQPALVTVTSGEMLDYLLQLAGPQADPLRQLPLLVGGERIAAQAADAAFEHIIVAQGTTPAALLEALLGWWTAH